MFRRGEREVLARWEQESGLRFEHRYVAQARCGGAVVTLVRGLRRAGVARLAAVLEALKERLPRDVRAPLSRSYIGARQVLMRGAGRLLYPGDHVACPCCGSTYRRFRALGTPNRMCWSCGSLERDRLLWLLLQRRPEVLRPGLRMHHVAPEPALRPLLRALPGVQ